MSYQILRCPYCGAEGEAEERGKYLFCKHCGLKFTDDAAEMAYKKLSENMQAAMSGVLNDVLFSENEKKYYNLRSLLWDKINARYTDSASIVSIARDIKKINPHDFLASFFEIANTADSSDVCDFMNSIDVSENFMFIDVVLEFMIKSLKSEYIMPVSYLIERAYKGNDLEKFEEYITKLETEAQKINSGIYETLMPRDVFIAYSSRDIDSVLGLMKALEDNGFSCFVALRNLQHGRDAVANYERALCEAMDNSKIVVFVSSKNSRNYSCDAIKKELPYIKRCDVASAPSEYKNNYERLPLKYKKPRIEYRLDDTSTPAADAFLKEFFAGLDYCESIDKVLARVVEYVSDTAIFDEAEIKIKNTESKASQNNGGTFAANSQYGAVGSSGYESGAQNSYYNNFGSAHSSTSGSSHNSSTDSGTRTFIEDVDIIKNKITSYFSGVKEKIGTSKKNQSANTYSSEGNLKPSASAAEMDKLRGERKNNLIIGGVMLCLFWPVGLYFLYKAYKINEIIKKNNNTDGD